MSNVAALTKGIITSYLTKNAIEVSSLPTLISDVSSALQDIVHRGSSANGVSPPKHNIAPVAED